MNWQSFGSGKVPVVRRKHTSCLTKVLIGLFVLVFSGASFAQDFFESGGINEIRLEVQINKWDKKLETMKAIKVEDRIPATIFLNGTRFDSIGFRYKGNSSYHYTNRIGSTKRPFNIKSDEFLDDQRFSKFCEKIKLSNGFRDPSFVREVLSYEIAREYMPAPMANFSKLYINDEYIGLYTSVESIEGRFLKKHYGEKDGPFFKCDPIWGAKIPNYCYKDNDPRNILPPPSLVYLGEDSICYSSKYECKSDYGWREFLEFVYILNKKPAKLESVLNVDQTLWMHAFNNVFVNLDSYLGLLSHNYYLYQDEFGIFQPLIWDMNLSFGGFNRLEEGKDKELGSEEMATMSPYVHFGNDERPLVSQMLRDKLYRRIYVAHLRTILEDWVFNDRYLERAREIRNLVAEEVLSDKNKLYSDQAFKDNLEKSVMAGGDAVVGISELMQKRKQFYLDHPLIQREPPIFSKVRHLVYKDSIRFEIEVTNGEEVLLCYRLKQGAPFKRVPMTKVMTSGGADGKETFEYSIPYYDVVDYYVIGLNEKAAALEPRRAAFEYIKIRME